MLCPVERDVRRCAGQSLPRRKAVADVKQDRSHGGAEDARIDDLRGAGRAGGTNASRTESAGRVWSVNTEAFPLFVTYGDRRWVASITESVELNGL
jgi:hypothetical protein